MAQQNISINDSLIWETMTRQHISINDSLIWETMTYPILSFNYSIVKDDSYELGKFFGKYRYAEYVLVCLLAVIEIPVMILTLIALCFLVKSRPAASVFISQLILSDLIQVICLFKKATITSWDFNRNGAYGYSLIVGVYFMACVSIERYLLVSHPIWYKTHQSLKLSCFISVIVWFVPLIFAEIYPPRISFETVPLCIAFLIPYIIIILCFVGTCRGLSHSISLTALKRKLILGSLFLVLLTYTFIILPFVIMVFTRFFFSFSHLSYVKFYFYTHLYLYVNPLADCLLYLFMRPDVGDLMKSVCCCCRHQRKHNQDELSVTNPQNSCSTVVYSISAQKPASHSLNTCSSV